MFTKYDKAIVALIMAGVALAQQVSGVNLGLDEAAVTTVVGLVTSLLVYLVPNKVV